VGFLYGWTLFLVIQSGTIAAVAAVSRLSRRPGALGSPPDELDYQADRHLFGTP